MGAVYMIVGPDWIWLHFPKCGGTSAERLLKENFLEDPAVDFDPLDPADVIWHENVLQRQKRVPDFSAESKRIVAGFRRLPDWILSRVHYEASRPPFRLVSRQQLVAGTFFENSGHENTAELTFRGYSHPNVHTWIRLENMHEDFEKFFGVKLKPVEGRLNENSFGYIRDTRFWFTKEELEGLYNSAPSWASTEKAVYGDLLV